MQLVKYLILDESLDNFANYIAQRGRDKSKQDTGRIWRPDREADEIKSHIEWEEKYQSKPIHTLRRNNTHSHTPTLLSGIPNERRQLITGRLKGYETEAMRVRLFSLCRGGNYTTWDKIMDNDIGWKEMIYDLPENVMSFRLNGIAMTLPSISNLCRWGLRKGGKCNLCGKPNATAAHTLSNCPIALFQGRYTWRHDNVLATLARDFHGFVLRANREFTLKRKKFQSLINFVPAGYSGKMSRRKSTIFHKFPSDDWNVNIDFHGTLTIPLESKVDTILRPDVVFYSVKQKVILWGELTCPLERNIADAQIRKTFRYSNLETSIRKNNWKVFAMTFEIGDLGFVSKTTHHLFRSLCDNTAQCKFMRKRASVMSLRSSFYIWMSRHNKSFIPPNLAPRPDQLRKVVGSAVVNIPTYSSRIFTQHTSTHISCSTSTTVEQPTNDNSSDDMNFSFDSEQLDDILEIAKSCLESIDTVPATSQQTTEEEELAFDDMDTWEHDINTLPHQPSPNQTETMDESVSCLSVSDLHLLEHDIHSIEEEHLAFDDLDAWENAINSLDPHMSNASTTDPDSLRRFNDLYTHSQ